MPYKKLFTVFPYYVRVLLLISTCITIVFVQGYNIIQEKPKYFINMNIMWHLFHGYVIDNIWPVFIFTLRGF